MAEVLINFEFVGGRGKKKVEYPYDKWLDGRIYRLVEDEDYQCSTNTMINYVRQEARKRNLVLKVQNEKISFVLQAYPIIDPNKPKE